MASGFLVLLIASLFQGSFGLGMKNYKPFSWEAFWVVFSIIGILIFPILWTSIEVPGFSKYIWATPMGTLILAAGCGFLWGVSAIWYGKAIDNIGLSLTVGINTGVGTSLGSLIPLFILDKVPPAGPFAVLLAGMAIMLVGVGVITKAGLMKDAQSKTDDEVSVNDKFMVGLTMALLSGFGTAAMNIGYTFAHQASVLAVTDGVDPVKASLIAYVIVFAGGAFIANLGYAPLCDETKCNLVRLPEERCIFCVFQGHSDQCIMVWCPWSLRQVHGTSRRPWSGRRLDRLHVSCTHHRQPLGDQDRGVERLQAPTRHDESRQYHPDHIGDCRRLCKQPELIFEFGGIKHDQYRTLQHREYRS